MEMNMMVYPLSGVVGNSFEAVRMSAAKMGGTISTVALVLGCFFFGIRMIKMYYDIVSDEQHGGFGGIRVMDVLRPILILLLIAGYSQVVVRPVDALANIASSVVGGTNSIGFSAGTNKLKGMFRDAKDAYKTAKNEDMGQDNPENEPSLGFDPGEKQKENMLTRIFGGVTHVYDTITIFAKGIVAGTAKAAGTLVDTLMIWFFSIMATVVRILSDIMLTILVMIGPLMLAFSVFDKWKDYPFTFIGQYIQFSLWKPIVGLVSFATMNVNDAVGDILATGLADLSGFGTFTATIGAFMGAIGETAIIVFAGIQTLKQVPTIANAIVNLASGMSEPINAPGIAGAAAGGVGTLASGASAVMHGVGGAIRGARTIGGVRGAIIGAQTYGHAGRVGSAIGRVGRSIQGSMNGL